jgi:SAM-dependent methyltransferase
MADFKYVGAELDLFAEVHNWKTYWSRSVRPFIHGDVIEVGAGIGSNTRYLDSGGHGRWVALEPDAERAGRLAENLAQIRSRRAYETATGSIKDLDAVRQFDTLIYIDVLEHIENDREELENAAKLLRACGRIIVLSPAHQWLFTPFDAAIGHFRRYNRASLRSVTPHELALERLFYLDSAGFVLSMANKLFLRQSMPTRTQLAIWDRWVIPVSRVLDKCLFNALGKSIVGVWRRNGEQ